MTRCDPARRVFVAMEKLHFIVHRSPTAAAMAVGSAPLIDPTAERSSRRARSTYERASRSFCTANGYEYRGRPQFQFEFAETPPPDDRDSAIAALTKAPGLGERRATTIVDVFGHLAAIDTLIDGDPEAIAKQTGIPAATISEAAEWLQENRADVAAWQAVFQLFNGVPQIRNRERIIRRANEAWGPRAEGIIRRDPFRLLRCGASIDACWKLWRHLGLPQQRLKPQAYAIVNLMAKSPSVWQQLGDADRIGSRRSPSISAVVTSTFGADARTRSVQ